MGVDQYSTIINAMISRFHSCSTTQILYAYAIKLPSKNSLSSHCISDGLIATLTEVLRYLKQAISVNWRALASQLHANRRMIIG